MTLREREVSSGDDGGDMAKPTKHGGNWRIRWTDANGKRRTEVYTERRDAKLALSKHVADVEETRRGIRPLGAPARSPTSPTSG